MRGSDFAELTAFAAVVELASFSQAAQRVGVSPSALSQTIRQLEERLGVRLLNRTTRSVSPTAVGARLYERLSPIFEAFAAATAEAMAAEGRVSGVLRINAPRVARRIIGPRLSRFLSAYPDVALDIFTEDKLTDIVAGRFDAGIRIGERLEKDMVAIRISPDMEMMAVAAPGYLEARGTPKTPADLHAHACLNWRWPTGGEIYRWEFEENGKDFDMAVSGPLIFTDADFALEAALRGLGIVYTFDERIYGWIAEGRLKRVLKAYSPVFPGLYLYHSSRRHTPAALRAFIDCLLDRDLPAGQRQALRPWAARSADHFF